VQDATPFQTIAHGFVPTPIGVGPVLGAIAEGVLSITRTAAGATQIILDPGLPGGGAVALEDIRIQITPETPSVPVPISVSALAFEAPSPPVGTGATVIAVLTFNASTAVQVDNGYWFVISRPLESSTST
jgi:hypothetical protein